MSAAWNRLTPRQKSYTAAAAIALVATATVLALWLLGGKGGGGETASDTTCKEVLYWYDPMVPAQRFDKPGKSPMGMEMIPKCAAGEAGQAAGVTISSAAVQNFGIRTATAEYGTLEPETTVTGTIAYNGRNVAVVQPRVGGFVQRTYGRAPQDVVPAGAPLADLLVPEWGGAQQEYRAIAGSDDPELAQAARERMRLLGMPESMIASVARGGKPRSTITITAPVSGAITQLGVRPGMTVMAGQTLAEISGLNPIWLEAAVPEIQAGEAKVGQPVNATLTAFPGERFGGRIIAILPSAQAESRTITLRAELRNPGLKLRPGMFAQVSLTPAARDALLVPSEAVIRTGERTLVMLAQPKGGYRPAEVRVGREADGKTEVLAGLAPGEKVITSGQFLLDSEASLSELDVRPIGEAPAAASDAARPKPAQAKPPTYSATGTIQAITAKGVTLQHSAIPALKWPAMTMTFATQGPAQLRGLKRGEKVQFTFARDDKGAHIVAIRKAGGQ